MRFLRADNLAHQVLHGADDRGGEEGDEDGVESEGADGLAQVDALVAVLEGDDGESAHDEAAEVEVGEAAGASGGMGSGGGISMFEIILLAGIGYLIYRFIKKKREDRPSSPYNR